MNSSANESLLEQIRSLKGEHPYWGYRRIWAYMKFIKHCGINRKRVWRLMKAEHLLVPKNLKLKATRSNTTEKPRTVEPNQYWGIDMTKVMLPHSGWVYLHVVIDWGTKKLLAVNLSETSKTSDWIDALNEAVNLQYPDGIQGVRSKPLLVSDHGSQPTSLSFIRTCAELGIEHIFASYCNPKGNADTERVMRTIKEDLVWTHEFDSILSFKTALAAWVKAYNTEYPHSSLNYMTPYEYERWFTEAAA